MGGWQRTWVMVLAGCGAAGPAAPSYPSVPPVVGVQLYASTDGAASRCGGTLDAASGAIHCVRLPEGLPDLSPASVFADGAVSCEEDPAFCERCDELPGVCGARMVLRACAASRDRVCGLELDLALRASAGEPAAVFVAVREGLARRFGPGYPAGERRCAVDAAQCLEDGDELAHRYEGEGYILELRVVRAWLPAILGVSAFLSIELRAK